MLNSYKAELGALAATSSLNHPARHGLRTSADIAESRIFSFFAQMMHEYDSLHKAHSNNMRVLDRVQRERDEAMRQLNAIKITA